MRAAPFIATGVVILNSSTATQVVPRRLSRQMIRLGIGGVIYVGPSGVTISTGFALIPNAAGFIELETAAELYALSSAESGNVSFIEFYD